ncbi:MAG: type II toxin-antitoxin system CcdA family antitoxin [Sideroxydans sp.]|nr:type II toxin-antitoxin system CcdA family antitoxin [Sideroxydans sp.]
MSAICFDTTAPKKATNLSINSDLLRQAKELNINLSQTVEQLLSGVVREAKEQQWRADHAGFIAAYNKHLEAEGLPLEQYRTF